MPKLGTSGSVRGARGNSRPYRDPPALDLESHCPSNEPWRTVGRSLPMLDAAAKTHILRCCKVYELYLWV